MKIYLKTQKQIAFIQEKATSDFWDKHWDYDDLRNRIVNCKDDGLFVPLVSKYLPKESKILEGGCGIGQIVHALKFNGYNSIGIDFAKKTIDSINKAVPEIEVREGDVRKLCFEDNYFDGYISIGVIEHFYDGYDDIIKEMGRVIKPGGFLFISFPYMSPLRIIKSKLGLYSKRETLLGNEINNFYQFALNHYNAINKLKQLDFYLIEKIPFDGIKGFKDEVIFAKPYLQNIYDGKGNQKLRPFYDNFFKPFASHCILLVLKKNT